MSDNPGIVVTDKGLYCPSGDFYIDPWKPVKQAVVTHGHADHLKRGSKIYHISQSSRSIIEHRIADKNQKITSEIFTYDFDETLSINGVTLSLHPAGHVLGSAQVRVEIGSEVYVVSGDYKRSIDPSCEPFELVKCDTFITEGTFGLPIYRWDPGDRVANSIFTWWQQNAAEEKPSVLFSYSLGKTQRILAELSKITDKTVYLHGALNSMTESYRASGIHLLSTELVSNQDKMKKYETDLVMGPPSALRSKWMSRFKGCETGFASGWMRIRGRRRMGGYDKGFVISDHADWPNLIRTIKETGANSIQIAYTNSPVFRQYIQEELGLDAVQLETEYTGVDD